jgi:hypothetical protein
MRLRTDMHRLQELVRLHRMGVHGREAARQLRMGRNTHRQYREAFAAAGLLEGDPAELPALAVLRACVPSRAPPQHVSTIDSWSPIVTRLVARGVQPQAIWCQLKLSEPDFKGSLDAVKRLCRRLRRAAPPRDEDVAIPVETAPGEVAQVDFGYVGRVYDPEAHTLRKAWVFVAEYQPEVAVSRSDARRLCPGARPCRSVPRPNSGDARREMASCHITPRRLLTCGWPPGRLRPAILGPPAMCSRLRRPSGRLRPRSSTSASYRTEPRSPGGEGPRARCEPATRRSGRERTPWYRRNHDAAFPACVAAV